MNILQIIFILFLLILAYIFGTQNKTNEMFNKHFFTKDKLETEKINPNNIFIKENFMKDQNKGLDKEGLNEELNKGLNEELNKGLNEELKEGLNEGLNEELNEDLNEGLNEVVNEQIAAFDDENDFSIFDDDRVIYLKRMLRNDILDTSRINILYELWNRTDDYKWLFQIAQIYLDMNNIFETKKFIDYIIYNSNDEYYIDKARELKDQVLANEFLIKQKVRNAQDLENLKKIYPINFQSRDIDVNRDTNTNRVITQDHELQLTNEEVNMLLNEIPVGVNQERYIDTKEYNDPQNVHNSGVVNTIKNSIIKLDQPHLQIEDTITELKNKINLLPQTSKNIKAGNAINYYSNQMNYTLGATEREVLARVYARIKTYDPETQRDLLNNLVNELSEVNKNICSTGKVSRAVDTLNGIDKDVKIMPMYLIKEEMLTKAALLRKQFYNEKGITNDLNMSDEDSGVLKKVIKDSLMKDYVNTGILSDKQFEKETDWIDYI